MVIRVRGQRFHVYTVLVCDGLCGAAVSDSGLLLSGAAKTAYSRSEGAQQGKAAVASQGYETGADRDHGVRPMLVAVLDIAGGADQFGTGGLPFTAAGHHVCAGRLSGLLEFGDESDFICIFE